MERGEHVSRAPGPECALVCASGPRLRLWPRAGRHVIFIMVLRIACERCNGGVQRRKKPFFFLCNFVCPFVSAASTPCLPGR